ncbi:MAG: 23S rRNA (uracil(1939)-C(5))-methyltransferase RlmD [Lachnospiraceae bacterium]|nr:23S rRNA (uracil(1939)-C(5))-methyltransferase RlmD [Lachnospiraceae bacterium]
MAEKNTGKNTGKKSGQDNLDKELEQWISDFYKNGGKVTIDVNGKKTTSAPRTTGGKTNRKSGPGAKNESFGAKNRTAAAKNRNMDTRSKKADEGKPVGKPSAQPKRNTKNPCPISHKCGGCQLLHLPYEKQLKQKQQLMEELLKGICPVHPITGMENPWHYRNKVHAVFDHDKFGNPISGVYEAKSHRVVPVEKCLIEDEKADEIIGTIRGMLKSFKIRTYDEDSGYGLLRHVLIRRGFASGQIMVVLVTASPVFPSKNHFVKALLEKHPEITTIVQNVNDRATSMVLGDREHVLYGKGYIEDTLCGRTFRISSKSFYQINPVQTEKLYRKAMKEAGLTGTETVIDAYCGIGTIGMIAAADAGKVIGVELNQDAVRDAVSNAKANRVENIRFYCNDAGRFMTEMADAGEHADVVFMDPPRSGSTEEFMRAVRKLGPSRVVYISCGPQTLAIDLKFFRTLGYRAVGAWPFDMFPGTEEHVETVVVMTYGGVKKK